jgi:hypothetical protein
MAVAPAAGVVVVLFMALPFFVESAPRAYRLKAGNADPILFNIPRDIPFGGIGARLENNHGRDENG